jgi:hypothetical protein
MYNSILGFNYYNPMVDWLKIDPHITSEVMFAENL